MSFDISVLPKEEGKSFLVLAPTVRGRGEVVWHQYSWFEGKLYPDALGGIDRTDHIVIGTIIDYAELPKENKQMKTQETIKAWGLQDKDGSFYGFTYSSRKRARVEKSLLKEWGCEARVVKVQIQVLN